MYDVRLGTRISDPVDRRLRSLVLIKGQPLSHVLDAVLDEALPSAEQLAADVAELLAGRHSDDAESAQAVA